MGIRKGSAKFFLRLMAIVLIVGVAACASMEEKRDGYLANGKES